MVLNVTNGPRPSGDGETVNALNMGNLKTIKQSVATYNLKTNKAVKAACISLDDQEGRAFLAADLMSIELVRDLDEKGNSRCNEARVLGEEIDEMLQGHDKAWEQLGAKARQAKKRAREKLEGVELEDKIAAIEKALVADRAALSVKPITFTRLPDPDAKVVPTRVRERPPPPPPAPPRSLVEEWRRQIDECKRAEVAAEAEYKNTAAPSLLRPHRTH